MGSWPGNLGGRSLPYVALGCGVCQGPQGDDPKYLKTVATPKHFAVRSGPETTRHTVDVRASRHDMEDTYLPAFRATVMEGKAESVMWRTTLSMVSRRARTRICCSNIFVGIGASRATLFLIAE